MREERQNAKEYQEILDIKQKVKIPLYSNCGWCTNDPSPHHKWTVLLKNLLHAWINEQPSLLDMLQHPIALGCQHLNQDMKVQ